MSEYVFHTLNSPVKYDLRYLLQDGQEHLIPSVPDFVLERNLDEGYIRVRLIEGM